MENTVNNVSTLEKHECCGCGSCFNKCPTHAITMEMDGEGFLYPVVDEEKCIQCGLCRAVCPSIHPSYHHEKEPKVYAAWAPDEIRRKSSAGGVFTLLAEKILEEGGIVCGAAFDENVKVVHICVDNKKDLEKLKGAKYVMSDTKKVYTEIEAALLQERKVLFTGSPCQVAGLYSFLGGDYDKLFTIDIMCTGETSPGLFEKYKEQVHAGREVASVKFRDKDKYGWRDSMTIKYKDAGIYQEAKENDPFYLYFSNHLAQRPFCDTCKFAKLPRQGDITLGDFNGIARFDRALDDERGTSVVTLNSEKGVGLYEQIQSGLAVSREVPLQFLLDRQLPFQRCERSNPNRTRFLDLVMNYGYSIEKAYDYCLKDKYDVAIYGLWWGSNYGSIMTYYSLYKVIDGMGKTVIMIDHPAFSPEHLIFHSHARVFAKQYYKAISPVYDTYEDLWKMNYKADAFVIGSDQVWNQGIAKTYHGGLFLKFVEDDKKKLSYAASFGHDRLFMNQAEIEESGRLLERFDAISVREDDGVRILEENFHIKGTQVVDPVFLAQREIYDEVEKTTKYHEDVPFLTAYILDPTPEKKKAILHVAKKLNLKPVVILDGFRNKLDGNLQKMNMPDEVLPDIDVQDWLYYIKNCDYFITDSCHGASFAIIYHRNFACIGNEQRGMARFYSLVNLFHLENHLIMNPLDLLEKEEMFEKIDYDAIEQILQSERARSYEWLETALNEPKIGNTYRDYTVVDNKGKEYSAVKLPPENPTKYHINEFYKKYVRKHINTDIEKKVKKVLYKLEDTDEE